MGEEAPPLQAWNRGAPGDPKVSEEHRAADPQAALPEARSRDRAGLQDVPEVPELRRGGAAGRGGGVPGGTVQGHQSGWS
ncbi:hypothetical protein RJ639_008940 [Escallonia herrerae]|uniref:Uncharacterized protein n=1 Tax=Escallonia herrerae TaxID=1293975 RepID=A0AA88VUP9_9ASTE|nr:hypothetical protein RJ639_008940 [Escallonia herrerae]